MLMGVLMGVLLVTGCVSADAELLDNSKPIYGSSGLPKNCRAIIAANVRMYRGLDQTDQEHFMTEVDGVMDSINRNCGEFGSSWGDAH
jgi:hypothetical protein